MDPYFLIEKCIRIRVKMILTTEQKLESLLINNRESKTFCMKKVKIIIRIKKTSISWQCPGNNQYMVWHRLITNKINPNSKIS